MALYLCGKGADTFTNKRLSGILKGPHIADRLSLFDRGF